MSELFSAAIYAPIGAIVVAFIQAIQNRRQNKATGNLDAVQGAKVVQGMALELLDPLKLKINKLEEMISELELEAHILRDELKAERMARADAEFERDRYKLFLEGA